MPTVDPELVRSLSKISDILVKRPGKVNIEGIKRLSNLYGFETFTDTLTISDDNQVQYGDLTTTINSTGNKHLITRLTLSGKILLIDIDFLSDNTTVKNVSLSSAISIIPLNNNQSNVNKGINFIEGRKGKEVEKILNDNLQFKTLDKFNKNLRIISQFDKLSMNSPNDLFNFFNQLSYNLISKHENQIAQFSADQIESCLNEDQLLQDLKNGYYGIGKLEINVNEKIGLFLKVWEDNRFVNQVIYNQYSGIKTYEMQNPYLIHFKIRERSDFINDNNEFNDFENNAMLTNTENNDSNNNNGNEHDSSSGTEKDFEELKKSWFDEEGNWRLNMSSINTNSPTSSNLKLLMFEILPCIWIPEDFIYELGINTFERHDEFIVNDYEDPVKREILDIFYNFYNDSDSSNNSMIFGNYNINLLLGCKLIKLTKFKLEDLPTQLELIMNKLRSWILVNNLLFNLITKINSNSTADTGSQDFKAVLKNSMYENVDYESDLNLADLVNSNKNADIAAALAGGPAPTTSNNKISISFQDLNNAGNQNDFYVTLKINSNKFLIRNGQVICKTNNKLAKILAMSEDITKVV